MEKQILSYADLNGIAKRLSIKAHAGQKYGGHDYFDYHICGVVSNVQKQQFVQGQFQFNSVTLMQCKIVAYLHDAVEDSDLTLEDLREYGFTEVIIEAVGLITKTEDTVLDEYLEAIRNNEIALIVKKADMSFNMMNNIIEGNKKRFEKYARQMSILLG